jgi:hypothetical protein
MKTFLWPLAIVLILLGLVGALIYLSKMPPPVAQIEVPVTVSPPPPYLQPSNQGAVAPQPVSPNKTPAAAGE